MKRKTKGIIAAVTLGFCTLVMTGCTKSFCTVQDKAELMATYEEKNLESINKKAADKGILLPQQEFIAYIDTKVEEYVASEECPKDLEGKALTSFARFAGYNEDNKPTLFYNYDKWYEEAAYDLGVDKIPSYSYISFYKSSLKSGISGKTACISTEDGKFGLAGNEVYVEGKTWGQAFKDYGFLEGLLVYPIAAMLHTFTKAFGPYGGQTAAILLVTLIIRLIVFAITFPATRSQNKMSELQPQLAALQQKYPNASTNTYDKQKLAQEQMQLYKNNHIHPFLQMLLMIPQMIIFICVVSALQGSAILSQGTIFNVEFTNVTYKAIFSWSKQTPFAIILFLLMAVSQMIATLLPQAFQKWKEKRFTSSTVRVQPNQQQKTMKSVSYFMLIFIVLMGLTLQISMAIYWFVGALLTICQTLVLELINTHRRHKHKTYHNDGGNWQKNKNKKKSSDRFSIRRG